MRPNGIVFAALSALLLLAALSARAADNAAAPIRLPFHVKNGLILIDGRVDSTAGVIMLDTGSTYFRFVLNRNYLQLGPGTDLFRMHAESGQVSMVQTHEGPHHIVLADALTTTAESGNADAAGRVVSDDFQQMMKNLDPKILGVVGYAFLKQYDFTIDYQNGVVTLYAPGSAPRYAHGITINFVPASPVVPFMLKFGHTEVPTVIDTGGWEEFKAPADVWVSLTAGGFIKDASADGKNCYSLSGARYGSSSEFAIPRVNKVVAAAAKDEKLTLGYPFLRHYLSIYRSRDGTVTLVPVDMAVPINDMPSLPSESCE